MSMISNEYAVYLPAVNTNYARTLTKLPEGRSLPSGLTLDDLAFWKKDSKLWHHEHFLHSVGQYSVGANPSNAITWRASHEACLFGDSAGFQIGNGSLGGLKGVTKRMAGDAACAAWRQSPKVREWIVGYLETYTNYAMTIDMPLWATTSVGKDSPFHNCTQEQLTQLTVENLEYIDARRQGRTKWLNVIQGLDAAGMIKWWNAVKWFDCAGYAYSVESAKTTGLRGVLEPLLVMRDEGAFDKGHDWLHMLGSSSVPWAVMYTAVQRGIRGSANSKLRVSFDSSSPFQQACIPELNTKSPRFGINLKGWGFGNESAPQSHLHVGSDKPLPFSSPLADMLTLGDLNVNSDQYAANHFDQLSHLYLMNHNIWVYLTGFQSANDLAFASDCSQVPLVLAQCIDAIEEAFKVKDWRKFLQQEQKLLDNFKG